MLVSSGLFFKSINYKIQKKRKYEKLDIVDYLNWAGNNRLNYKFDVRNPRTFNEKINWLKVFYRNELWYKVSDKLGAKDFIKEKFGNEVADKVLPITYQKAADVTAIDLEKLPNKFVLKTNNDSGSVFVCEKDKTNFEEVFSKIGRALSRKYSSGNYEWIYDRVEPLVFAEELLEPDPIHDELYDYKLQYINGKLAYILVCSNRFEDFHQNLFDRNFNDLGIVKSHFPSKDPKVYLKPSSLDSMLDLGDKIASMFCQVRIDFYHTKNGFKIGEITLLGGSGFSFFQDSKWDYYFGDQFALPDPNYNLDLLK